jgi:hypothetical protein
MKLALALLACVLAASAAGIDGQWNAELSARNQKAAAAKNQSFTLALKSQDGQVTGFVMAAGKKRTRQQAIQNAKLDGNQLTFTTLQKGKKANVTFSWTVTVDGDQMSGTRTREGAKHGVAFKARKTG